MTLAYHFAVNLTSELKRTVFSGFSDDVSTLLLSADWPGNVRELKNTVERSVYRAVDPSKPIADAISNPFTSPYGDLPRSAAVTEPEPKSQADSADPTPMRSYPLDFKVTVADLERDLLHDALARAQHNQRIAADLLGLSYHQLRGLVRKYGA